MGINGILLEGKHDYSSIEKSYESVDQNTGNLLFRRALINEIGLLQMTYEQYAPMSDVFIKLPIIVTDLIWINENSNFDYLYNRVVSNPDIKFIPISVGLQASSTDTDFALNDSVLKTLNAIQERAIIGVRGEFTASVLEKNGIKNIDVIGCPSMYNMGSRDFTINKKDKVFATCANFRTIYGLLKQKEKHFLSYCASHDFGFVEQTNLELKLENVDDEKYFNYVAPWMNRQKHIFFDVDEWNKYIGSFDFSFGARFHGNVIALWNGVPALFVTIDSRTKELTDFFGLPTIAINDFDFTKPLEYYYEKADYSVFNATYAAKYDHYLEFLKKNGVGEIETSAIH